MTDYKEIKAAIVEGDDELSVKEVEKLLAGGAEALAIINEGLLPGIATVGEAFKKGEVFVPEVMAAAYSMTCCMNILRPLINSADISSAGTVVIGTVKGDLHDIGKNLVAMMLESSSFAVVNLGTDVSAEQFMAAIKEHKPQILALSALLTTTMAYMQTVIKELDAAGLRQNIKVIVGGAPVSQKFANEIGADAYAANAAQAVEACNEILA